MTPLKTSTYIDRDTLKYSGIIVSGILLLYVPLIFIFPSFFKDDYYIFYKISVTPWSPVATDINEKYFLFLRPLSYLYFWIQYHLFSSSPIIIKMIGMVINITTSIFLYLTILRANNNFNLKINPFILSLIVFGFSLHKDIAFSVLWISNITELLSALFYVLVFYNLLGNDTAKRKIIISLICFSASILTKQQGIHLPGLLLIILVLKSSQLTEIDKQTLKFSIIGMITISIIFIVTNYYTYISGTEIFTAEYLIRKPFSIVGTILYIMFPPIGTDVYNYFLINRAYAYVIGITLLLSSVPLIWKYRIWFQQNKHKILIFALITMIIFLPRIVVEGGERLNIIQLLWFTFFLSIILSKVRKMVVIIILSIFISQNVCSSFFLVNNLINEDTDSLQFIEALEKYRNNDTNSVVVIGAFTQMYHINYEYKYNKNKRFAIDSTITIHEIFAKDPFKIFDESVIRVLRNGNELTIAVDSSSSVYLIPLINHAMNIKEYRKTSYRGYSSITVILPDSIMNSSFVFYNGNEFVKK